MDYLPQPHCEVMNEKTRDLSLNQIISGVEKGSILGNKKCSIPASKNFPWLDEELSQINTLAKQKKPWRSISKIINLLFHKGRRVRHGRECKKKWIFDLQNKAESSWRTEEDQILQEKKKLFGKKWGKISQFLYCRTGRQVKARAEYLVSKIFKEVQEKDNLNFNSEESGNFMYNCFDPNMSFKVESLSELENYGNILANSLCNPDVTLANFLLDDFCINDNDVYF